VAVVKVAVTPLATFSVTVQAPVPLHELPQPLKLAPLAGLAVRLTTVPVAKLPVHVPLLQLSPAGLLVTVPLPLTTTTRLVVPVDVLVVKVAVTLVAAFSVTVQLPVPLQAPPQPLKLAPLAGLAVRLTTVPVAKLPVHVPLLHVSPAGLLVTVPLPV